MAEDPPPPAISAAFPAPPPFYHTFTPENLSNLGQTLSSQESAYNRSAPTATATPIPNLTSLPAELRNLLPPPLPTGEYRSFGTLHSLHPPPQNPPPNPSATRTQLLTKTRTLLLHFLSITHILSLDPSPTLYGPKWDALKATFLEMHALVNAYRPHQARESLIGMMEEQIARLRGEIGAVGEGVERARVVVGGLGGEGGGNGEGGVNGGRGDAKEVGEGGGKRFWEREKRFWEIIGREVGRV